MVSAVIYIVSEGAFTINIRPNPSVKCAVCRSMSFSRCVETENEIISYTTVCPNTGCHFRIPPEGDAEHSETCQYHLFKCMWCDKKINADGILNHLYASCSADFKKIDLNELNINDNVLIISNTRPNTFLVISEKKITLISDIHEQIRVTFEEPCQDIDGGVAYNIINKHLNTHTIKHLISGIHKPLNIDNDIKDITHMYSKYNVDEKCIIYHQGNWIRGTIAAVDYNPHRYTVSVRGLKDITIDASSDFPPQIKPHTDRTSVEEMQHIANMSYNEQIDYAIDRSLE